jgi:hypothetical protein
MTTRTIKGVFQAAIFGGATCLWAAGARADSGANSGTEVPDHAQAEARTGAETSVPEVERIEGVPDHATAEARGEPSAGARPAERRGVPDHATAESRGEPSR